MILNTKFFLRKSDGYETPHMKNISRIIGSFAHEINNPLTMLQLGIDTLEYQFKDSKYTISDYKKIMDDIRPNIIRIVDIINKFEEIIVEKNINQPSYADFREVLKTAIHICENKIKEKKITYSVEIVGNLFDSYIIKEEVCHAIVNLIQNSIEALEHTKNPTIKFSLISNENIEFAITDNGCGILKEHQSSVFEPFFTTKEYRNLGLGLTQAFRLIERNKGKLFLCTESDQTKFVITF
jgi:signal transduction histidine kinase